MKRFLLVACLLVTLVAIGLAADEPRPLADAVADFNLRAAKSETGKLQPALTQEEVIAAIRGWMRDRTPVADATYQEFQTIAATGALPAGARLHFTTRWTGYNGYDFDVWWVDLTIKTGENKIYTFRIRDQKIASRPKAL
jgi:hypothetical protein